MGGRRSGRAAAKRASAALQTTPRAAFDGEDEAMPDAPSSPIAQPEQEPESEPAPEDDYTGEKTASADDEKDENADDADDAPKNEGENAAGDAEAAEAPNSETPKEPTPPAVPMVRRKRLGRPPKNRPPDWDPTIMVPASEVETPRRRGRGGWRGRGGRKPGAGGTPLKMRQAIDKEGTEVDIVNDECVLPEDPEGETKVDKNGVLQGDREYRCRTFTVLGRGPRLYMLSTEPARCVGFRDSYLFFTKHLKLHKIIVDDEEKRDMIDREIIPHSYKGRSIGICTARSVFREFGARIVVGGKRIMDDFRVADAREDGAVEGEIADPNDVFEPGKPYNKNQYVAWHGASAVYHQNPPATQDPLAGKAEVKKRKVNVNNTNWMLEHAREASNFNATINSLRKLNNPGVYDIHTNIIHYPAIMQPTHARIEPVNPSSPSEQTDSASPEPSTTFPDLDPKITRNFQVLDLYYESAPAGVSPLAVSSSSNLTAKDSVGAGAGAANADFLSPFRGLGAVSDDMKDLLPPECRKAFDEALGHENEWRDRWGTEQEACSRRQPIIDRALVPFR